MSELIPGHTPAPEYYPQYINPNPNIAVATSTDTPQYYTQQQALYPSAVPGYYVDANGNWFAPCHPGIAQNATEPLLAPKLNPVPVAAQKKTPKKQKVPVQHVWCDVCNIECTSKEVLEAHRQGKNHRKNLEILKATLAPTPKQIRCDVCQIECDTNQVLKVHEQGMKHKKNLEKLRLKQMFEDKLKTSTPPAPIGVIGPQENPKKRKDKENISEDLETKKKKVVENGGVADAVMTCEICNVVCNNVLVLEYHLAGRKHLAMVKKQLAKEAGNLEPNMVVENGGVVNAVMKCEICNVVCNNVLALEYHFAGRKHLAMVKKQLAKEAGNLEPKKVVEIPDLEAKKKIVVENGTAADTLRTCEICGVVCNNDLMLSYHLLGKSHLKMVKRVKGEAQAVAETPNPESVST